MKTQVYFGAAMAILCAFGGADLAQAQGKKSSGGASSADTTPSPTPTPRPAPAAEALPACPRDAGAIDHETPCNCANPSTNASLWGTDTYTTDSNVCAAALHAGAIGAEGGDVVLIPSPGLASYAGSTRNGVTSSDWGSYGASFQVVATPVFGNDTTMGSVTCSVMPSGLSVHMCACPAGAPRGSVWGNDPYTGDSDICSAAVHSGYLDDQGGDVYVLRVPGLAAYRGVESFGVVSQSWERYDSSITFDWNR